MVQPSLLAAYLLLSSAITPADGPPTCALPMSLAASITCPVPTLPDSAPTPSLMSLNSLPSHIESAEADDRGDTENEFPPLPVGLARFARGLD